MPHRLLPVLLALFIPSLAVAAPSGGEVDRSVAMFEGATGLIPWLVVLPILMPLIGAGLSLTVRSRSSVQHRIAFVALLFGAIAALALFLQVSANGPLTMVAGNWLPPFGIVMAVDPFGALLVLVTALVGLAGLAYARGDVDEAGTHFGFYTFYCLLIAGVTGAFSTGDIFNLYVWFEVFLVSSFGLIVLGGRRVQLDGAVKYGVLNLIATTIFLIAVGVLYGFTGTLNMADIHLVVAELDGAPIVTVGAMFVMAFAMKAAAIPLHFWLPASYHTPKVIVSALFAGLLTKVGIYSLMRVMIMLFADQGSMFIPIIGWLGVITAIFGAVGALAQVDLKRMAAFLVVSGVGVMLIGLGYGTEAGLTGAIVYAVHSILAMTAIFLVLGYAQRLSGVTHLTTGTNLYAVHGLAATLFLVFGFAAAGLPPFSGFWPKLMLVEAGYQTGDVFGIAGIVGIILSGLFTTIAIGRAWVLVYLRPPQEDGVPDPEPTLEPGASTRPFALALVALAALIVAMGLFPSTVIDAARSGAQGLLDPAAYLERVLKVE
ncbi:Na+/H+ antiporter subunit D [Acuticoccus sp. M5D2P5]|uniref:proton-conducting transporter transmembrane domain-containing protein n=1 Tax=Acuticoccus kalidii TaxID=2910977 RepID=UPI001F2433CF|nr:proton-conducting transporter membrane subunit [Acuticoccus kalidii]MCF3935593.1 Na+/H+ antiporter subunit D [Acuticoccus kalidii]